MNDFGARTMSVGLIVVAVIVVTAFILLVDLYDCWSHGKFNGNFSIRQRSDLEKTQVDLRMHVWLQSRLHTANINVVNCMVYVDTSSGHRLEMLQGTLAQQPPIAIKPKSLWSAWDGNGNAFADHNDSTSFLTRTMVVSNINYTNVDMFMTDTIIYHDLVMKCVVDGSVDLFSLTTLRIPVKNHTFTVHKNLNHYQLKSDQNILQLMRDLSKAMSIQRNQDNTTHPLIYNPIDNQTHAHSVLGTSVVTDQIDVDMVSVDDSNATHHQMTTFNEVSISLPIS